MAEEPKSTFQIILDKVEEDKQPDAALFLSGCFSLPPSSTPGIVSSAPIAMLTDLTKRQAEAIMGEFALSLPDGVRLRVVKSDDPGKVSRLQWPRPPKIYGRDVADFDSESDGHIIKCPICGGVIRVFRDANGQIVADVPTGSERRTLSSRRVVSENDKDPIFSGVKPLAPSTTNLASLDHLRAGDTGFWRNHTQEFFDQGGPTPPSAYEAPSQPEKRHEGGDSTHGKRSTVKLDSGLAAFMKRGAFAVVVGRTKDPQAVKMVAEIMGISPDEARDRCLNLGLCVARDIALDEAQSLLARFKGAGAKARIVKPM